MIVPEVILGVSLLILFVTIGLELGYTTIIISHVTFCFPFVMVAVQARLAGLDPVARGGGARSRRDARCRPSRRCSSPI